MKKTIIPCPSSCLYIYSPSICIYTREMTPNVYLVVLFFFFCFPLTLNSYSLASSIFLKYSQMGSSTFARTAAVFTRICIYVCMCVCIWWLFKYVRNSFAFSLRCGSFAQKKAKRRQRPDIDVSLPFVIPASRFLRSIARRSIAWKI